MALIIPGSWVRVPPAPQQETAGQTPAPEYCLALGEPVRLLANPGSWGVWSDHESMPSLDELEARLAVFRTDIDVEGAALLTVGEVRDRATVFLDGDGVGVLDRERQDRAIMLPRGRGRLEIVVEDQDRVNYGSRIGEPKGLVGPVQLGSELLSDWSACAIDLDGVPRESGGTDDPGVGPTAWRATFVADQRADHFLHTENWGKGLAWVIDFCLGRYWRRGPQQTLFVPGPVVRSGHNELVVLELDVMADPTAHFGPAPSLGPQEL
jgi:beta-galactosidase